MALRDVTEADLPVLFEQQRDPEVAAMAVMTPRDRDAFMAHWRTKVLADARTVKKAIDLDGTVAGYVVAFDQDGERRVGYLVGRAYWGKGLATAALAELVARHEPSRPLVGRVAVSNRASRRVLEKCGFVQAGGVETADDGVDEWVMRLA